MSFLDSLFGGKAEPEPKPSKSASSILEGREFSGSRFNSWFFLESLEEAKRTGVPYANACFELSDQVMIAHGTRPDETPRQFIDSNADKVFIVDPSQQPLNVGGWTTYYARVVAGKASSADQAAPRNLGSIRFVSTDHIRYQNGRNVSGHNHGAKRGIMIEPNIGGGEGYTVTMHNLDGPHSAWGDNIQMAPKQMRVVSDNESSVELRGFGNDPVGASFSDYGITLFFKEGGVDKIVLHMRDRDTDIEYLK